jgi:alpha-glucosidase (family GH31 glycosyl hydrolase)
VLALADPQLESGQGGTRNAVAPTDAVVTSGSARFTVLTDRLIRMEYAASDSDPVFEDRATVAFINRDLGSIPSFTQSSNNGVLKITTDSIELSYVVGEEFSASSLSVTSVDSDSAFDSWSYGQASLGNLFGTIRTLDAEDMPPLNCSLVDSELDNKCGWDADDCACEWGLVSSEGWSLVDDATNYALSDDADFWDGPNIDEIDVYLFAHGRDYKGALNDYVQVGGSIAMLPRNALGVWWTRWYDFTQQTALDAIEDFRDRSLPVDILVLDMNWHTKNDWTGYSFDPRLYPEVRDMFEDLHAYGLTTAGNIHDADGVGSWETQFQAMCDDLGLDSSTTVVPFNISDQAAQNALEDDVMLALEDIGFDFWWIDWQQGESGYGAVGGKMNPTIWTAHMRATDKQRRGSNDRGMVLSRWGGLGGHRYQVGFSGDVKDVNWQTLAYQPYFSATASNVGFGYWSHDITGPEDNVELYTRWFQWGAYSSIMRMHDRGMSAGSCADNNPPTCSLVRPWMADNDHFVAMRDALRGRSALLPYLYTALRASYDTGVGVIRPLYYEHPEEFVAYLQSLSLPQYYLGDDMVVSPIVVAADNATGLAQQPLWVPPGTWVERTTGLVRQGQSSSASNKKLSAPETTTCPSPSPDVKLFDCATAQDFDQTQCESRGCCWNDSPAYDGAPWCFYSDEVVNSFVMKYADIDEVPVLVKSGAVLVEFPDSVNGGAPQLHTDYVGRASQAYGSLSLSVFLSGATSGSTTFYEDDATSTAYVTGASVSTSVSWSLDDSSNTVVVDVSAPEGDGFDEMPDTRDYEVRIVNSAPPLNITFSNGKVKSSVKAMRPSKRQLLKDSATASWSYDGATSTLIITLPQQSTASGFDVTITMDQTDAATTDSLLSGVRGVLRRAVIAKMLERSPHLSWGSHWPRR